MSFGEISTSFINELINKANIENVSKSLTKIKINGHDCEIKKGQLNLSDISDAFGVKNAMIKEWKTKNGTYLQKHFGEEVQVESETKRKPVIDMNCRYIDPRFLIQCMMGSSIEFNNWVTNIILGSFLYFNEDDDNSLFKYIEKLNENISNIQDQIESQRKENETIQKQQKKSSENDPNITKYMVVGFPTDKDFGRPYIKIINSDKLNDAQIAKLKKQGTNSDGYKLSRIEFSNNIKLKAAIQKYLKDKDIKHNPSNLQISLTDSFTKEYFDSIKDEMKKNVEEIMEELSKAEAEKKGKGKTKKSDKLDPDFEDEEVKEEKPKETKKKDTKKETKEVPKQEPKVENKPKTSSGKFDSNQVKFEDDEFEFSDEEF